MSTEYTKEQKLEKLTQEINSLKSELITIKILAGIFFVMFIGLLSLNSKNDN